MKREAILSLIESLSQSQGCYGRLLSNLMELTDNERDEVFEYWESMNFKDGLDFILFMES